jgi:hypothetical protein
MIDTGSYPDALEFVSNLENACEGGLGSYDHVQ